MDKNVAKLLQEQVNKELTSAYIYLDFSNYYLSESLNGFGNWFAVQAKEEFAHTQLFMNYLLDNGEKITLGAISAPQGDYKEFSEPLKKSLAHEKYITESINNIYDAAMSVKDFRTIQFLDWFIKEQGEEEKNAEDLINRFNLFATDGKGLYLLDTELAARTFTPPSIAL